MTNKISAALALTAILTACTASDDGGDENNETGSTSNGSASASTTMTSESVSTTMTSMTMTSSADSTTGSGACFGAGIGTAAVGDTCSANDDCESGVCTIFTDVPLNDDAVCADTPDGCATRITGTVFDFVTGEPLENATMKAAGALSAVADPLNAMAIATATSGADGRVDVTTDMKVMQSIAIVALVEAQTGYLTATGLAAPDDATMDYPVANGIHDLWSVPTAPLGMWSDALAMDAEVMADSLPLGDKGGVVGLLRDNTGAPIAGAVVESGAADTAAIIRYVASDNTVTSDMTTDTGIFVIIGANQLGEDFKATMGGADIPGATGRAGTANNIVFTLILSAD